MSDAEFEGMSYADFLEIARQVEKNYGQGKKMARLQKQPPGPLRRHQPRVTRMVSPRQRLAESQTDNEVRAAYMPDSRPTPVRKSDVGLTRAVGQDPKHMHSHGKATESRDPKGGDK